MKRIFILMLMIASCFSAINAQLMVDRTGKIGLGKEAVDTFYSKVNINSYGNKNVTAYVQSENLYGLYVNRANGANNGSYYSIVGVNSGGSSGDNYGLYTSVTGYSGSGSAIGAFGGAGGAGSGYNFGLLARLKRSNKGAAILATTEASSRYEMIDVGGVYAGYFCGDTRVTGTMTAGAFVTSSDYRLKDNIRSLSKSDECLEKLMDMNVVEFNNKQRRFETSASHHRSVCSPEKIEEKTSVNTLLAMDDVLEDTASHWYNEESPIIKNKHYGLVAQELKEIYPDLVVESQDGFLAINYLEIIPLLIRSVQELKSELDASKHSNAPVQREATRSAEEEATAIDAIVTTLYQNTPNPFTESTLVQCDIAEGVVQADIYIYDMNGKQIATYPIAERGAACITIEGRSLEAGMYLYALIADGQVIDTKRMILTK